MRVDLLEHNKEAYEKIRESLNSGKRKIAISHATGSGKSYLIAKLCEDYNQEKKLVLIPSRYIREQMQKLFIKYNIVNTDFMLYQKIIKMSNEDISAMDYQVVVLDEYHHDTSNVWGEKIKCLMETHTDSIIFGTSATPVRSDGVDTINELFEGNCASELPLSHAIAKKIVPLPTYVSAMYSLDEELERLREKVKNATNTKEEKEEFYKKINAMRSQIEKSYGVPIILNKFLKNKEGKYLVFCKNKRHLVEIKDTAIDWFKTAGFKDIHVYMVHSSYEDRDKEYNAFCNDTSHSLKLLFCVNMLNEGLHLEDISGVLLLRPTCSSIVWHQQIGRCIEANNTGNPVIIDATNNFQSIGQAVGLLKEVKNAIKKEKDGNDDFDDISFLDIDTFFVTGFVQEIQKMFGEIEGGLRWNWELYIQAIKQYKDREGDCDVPQEHVEVMYDGTEVKLGRWVLCMRSTKKGISNYLLNSERLKQLNELEFIWDSKKYKFEKKVNACIVFYFINKKNPSKASKNSKEKELGSFLSVCRNSIKNNPNYPEWKLELLKQIPTFFDEKESAFDRFYRMALAYKEKYGHVNIMHNDVIEGYNIGKKYGYLYGKYKGGQLKEKEISILKNIGIDITRGKLKKQHNQKMKLVIDAVNEGVIISKQNKFYKGVNLYDWKIGHKCKFTEEEIKLINKLIPNNKIPVRIIDSTNNQILGVYQSINKAGNALYEKYHVVSSSYNGTSAINKHLRGKIKNPIFKGRFRFEHADSKDCQTTS